MKLMPVTLLTTAFLLLSLPAYAANGVSVRLSVDQSEIDTALAGARTPQEAARLFAKLVTPAIGQAVAEALQQTLARTQAATDDFNNSQSMFGASATSLRLTPTEPNRLTPPDSVNPAPTPVDGDDVNNNDPQSPIAGWPDIILQNGLLMELHWPSPGLAGSGNLPVVVVQAPTAFVSSQGPLTISVTGTF
jgi:hypothetical protein